MKEAAEKYRKGLVSLAEAATMAKVSIYEMMEFVKREKIRPPPMSEEEMEDESERTQNIFKKLNSKPSK